MKKIYNNLTVENLVKTDWFEQFSYYQREQILKGLEANLDISVYAKTDFPNKKMEEIREELLKESTL